MDINGLIRVLECRTEGILGDINEKLVKFRYNNNYYRMSKLIESEHFIIISIQPEVDKKDEVSNIDTIKTIRQEIVSFTISEEFMRTPLDLYKDILFKVEGETGIGTNKFSITEEEMVIIVDIR